MKKNEHNETVKRVKLCYTEDKCPEVIFMENKDGKFVKIADDFGSEIKMTEKQFNILRDMAKKGAI